MRRREFIAGLGGAAAWPLVAHGKNPVVGMLTTSSSGVVDAGFRQGLADFGYIPGQNISLLRKEADFDRLDEVAVELLAANPDVIFGTGSQTTIALKRLTSTIPIVTMSTNPLGLGFVQSLARPRGNITGVSLLGPEVAGKRLELLKEFIPRVDTAAVLWNPDDPGAHFSLLETQAAGKALKIDLRPFETHTLPDLENAFAAANTEGISSYHTSPGTFYGQKCWPNC